MATTVITAAPAAMPAAIPLTSPSQPHKDPWFALNWAFAVAVVNASNPHTATLNRNRRAIAIMFVLAVLVVIEMLTF
jgi:hypothetical protein